MSRRIKITFSYVGTNYHGYQIQPDVCTVQGVLEEKLLKIFKKNIRVHASGRTDEGVHAMGQVAHFDVESQIDIGVFPKMLNYYLPEDIRIHSACVKEDTFDARRDAKVRHYRYCIIDRNTSCQYFYQCYYSPYLIDVKEFSTYFDVFLGTHDFSSYCSKKDENSSKIREIFQIDVYRNNSKIIIDIYGNAFLMNMVRKMIGMVLFLYRGKKNKNILEYILKQGDSQLVPYLASKEGLTLERVYYVKLFGDRKYYGKK